jgi:hypothetical protein
LGRAGVTAALAACAAVWASPAWAEQNTDQATLTQTFITSGDGTRLETNVYRPNGLPEDAKTPVIVYVSPYLNTGGSGANPPRPDGAAVTRNFPYELEAAGLFVRGYTFVQVALRGTAGSEGCNDMGGPGEQGDVVAAVEWAATQPWSNGKVGLWGHSYDGWTGVMGLANEPEGLAAVVADSPVVSPYKAVFMNGNAYLPEGYFIEAIFQYNDLLPPALASGQERSANAVGGTATNPSCYAVKSAQFRNPDPQAAFWQERELLARASGSELPVLMSFGFTDSLIRPTQFVDLWSSLRGPKRAWFGQWGHNPASAPDPEAWPKDDLVGRMGFSQETLDFFDEHLAGLPAYDHPPVVIERSDGTWRAQKRWPPKRAKLADLALLPGSYDDVPGNSATGQGPANPLDGSRPVPSRTSGDGSWTIGPPVGRDVRIAGVPRLAATTSSTVPGANLVGLVYDIDGEGQATLITRGAYVLDNPSVEFDLHPQDWILPEGHRLGVLLTGSDDSTFTPGRTGQNIDVTTASLSLPLLCTPRKGNLAGTKPSLAVSQRTAIGIPQDAVATRTSDALELCAARGKRAPR